ncbi:MAG: hypothetical protein JXB88_11300 [Spirochaetales bacterium]|nr:hypothetical protein [Spirochaetales bacterium]
MMNSILPLFVAIPLGASFLIALVSRKRKLPADIIANLSTLSLLVLSIIIFQARGVYKIGGWLPPAGINWVLDGFSNLFLVIINLISICATVFSIKYMKHYTGVYKYYSLFLLMTAGMNGVVLTGDMFNLFVFLEIASIASYALVAFGGEHEELEASFKYLVLGSLGSILILLGIALVYGMTGYLNMASISKAISSSGIGQVHIFAALLFITGFGIKAALVPFHSWLPDAHPSAPAPISAMLSGVLIKAIGIYSLIRIFFNVFGMNSIFGGMLIGIGILSMVIGVFLAVGQWDLKRLLAYHSISQMGYVILGIGLGGFIIANGGSLIVASLAFLGGLFHLLNHSVFKSLLFLCSGSIENATGTRQLKEMGGLLKKMPVTGTTCTIASLSIAGVPPFNGFWSKLIIVIAAMQAGYYIIGFVTILVSFVTLVSFLKVMRYSLWGPVSGILANVKESPVLMVLPLVLLALLCIGMGVIALPGVTEVVLKPAIEVLVRGAEYAGYVFSQL